jgi:8-oxo-dGTP pyrophosphatase MutT (NUDIX family)
VKFHQFNQDPPGWKTCDSKRVFSTPHLQVYEEHVVTPTRPEGCAWNVVHRRAAAVVAPLTVAGEWLLVRQERIPVRRELWEFPAGQLDEEVADFAMGLEATARRELREETGWELPASGELIALGMFWPSAGFTDEQSHLFLARGVEPSEHGAQPDAHEAIIDCRAFSSEALRGMIASGEIQDANTLATCARLAARGMFPELC